MIDTKNISLKRLFVNSWRYCLRKRHELALFSIVNALFMIVGFKILDSWHDKLFLLWLVPYYVFWCYFFRFYFERKPYMLTVKLFDTLLPSTRILLFTLLVMLVLMAIPLLIPIIYRDAPWVEKYLEHLQRYTESGTIFDLGMILILTLIAPLIFYRPMMSWIGSVIGRSGKLSTAFLRTKGNYRQFVVLAFIFNFIYIFFEFVDEKLGCAGWLFLFCSSFVTVLMNVVLAKTYESFFLEIES